MNLVSGQVDIVLAFDGNCTAELLVARHGVESVSNDLQPEHSSRTRLRYTSILPTKRLRGCAFSPKAGAAGIFSLAKLCTSRRPDLEIAFQRQRFQTGSQDHKQSNGIIKYTGSLLKLLLIMRCPRPHTP